MAPGGTWSVANVESVESVAAPDERVDEHVDVPSPCRMPETVSPFASGDFSLEAAEREFIRRALKETGWQRTRAAALLGITRATLHAKLKRYNIRPDDATLATMSQRDMAMLAAEE